MRISVIITSMKGLRNYKNAFAIVLILLILVWQVWEARHNVNKTSATNVQNTRLVQLYKNKQSDEFITVNGRVYRLLADDNKGSRHQRFLMDIEGVSVLVAHNIDLAPKVPLAVGDVLTLHGEYEYTTKGGVLHWTHHDPQGRHSGGWIEYNGQLYK